MLTIKTNDPIGLLAEIEKAIKEGKIETWRYEVHNSVGYFTHTRPQWASKARLKASIKPNELRFSLHYSNANLANNGIAGVYYGRFETMLLNHFSKKFLSIVKHPDATQTLEKIS